MTEGRIVAVASGKGGVGKTWFAITLAHACARDGRRVLLFDGDLGLANVDIQLGLTPVYDLGSVIANRVTLSEAALHHADGDFDIVVGRSGSGALSAVDPGVLERVLAALRQEAERYDLILLDLGAGLERPVRRMSAWADTMLVVATEEPTSLTDAYAGTEAAPCRQTKGRSARRGKPGCLAPGGRTDIRHAGACVPDLPWPFPRSRRRDPA